MENTAKTALETHIVSSTSRSPGTWAQVFVVAGLILILYARILIDLCLEWWNYPAASYGMLIPPLAFYVFWMRRHATFRESAIPDSRGLLVIAAGCVLFLLGVLGAEFFLARASFVIVITGLIWLFWGTARLKTVAFPLVLLVTMIPLPTIVYNLLAAPLQLLASDVATSLARMLGVTVYQDGNVIHLAGVSLGVAEACSGLQSLSSLAVASLLLGYLYLEKAVPRLLLFLISLPLAVAVNVIRVTGTAVLADHWQEMALGFYHLFSGWLVFVLGFVALLGISKLLRMLLPGRTTT